MKRARVTPTSRINDLEVLVLDLQTRLEETEEKLTMMSEKTVTCGNCADLAQIIKADEMRAERWELDERERAAERKEHEARGHELRAVSDVVGQMWEAMRLACLQLTPTEGNNGTVSPVLLQIANLLRIANPSNPPTTSSLSPSDILGLHEQSQLSTQNQASVQDPVTVPLPVMGDVAESIRRASSSGGGGEDFEMGDVDVDTTAQFVGPVGPPIASIVEMVSTVLTNRDVDTYDMAPGNPTAVAPQTTASTEEGRDRSAQDEGCALPQPLGPESHQLPTGTEDPTQPNPAVSSPTNPEVNLMEPPIIASPSSPSRIAEDSIPASTTNLPVAASTTNDSEQSPVAQDEHRTSGPDGHGTHERQLRQRTPGLDYLKIGNPQARGPRARSSDNSTSPTSPLAGPSLVAADARDPSVP
jgi:hypothetical protein